MKKRPFVVLLAAASLLVGFFIYQGWWIRQSPQHETAPSSPEITLSENSAIRQAVVSREEWENRARLEKLALEKERERKGKLEKLGESLGFSYFDGYSDIVRYIPDGSLRDGEAIYDGYSTYEYKFKHYPEIFNKLQRTYPSCGNHERGDVYIYYRRQCLYMSFLERVEKNPQLLNAFILAKKLGVSIRLTYRNPSYRVGFGVIVVDIIEDEQTTFDMLTKDAKIAEAK